MEGSSNERRIWVLQWNCQGLRSRRDELTIRFTELEPHDVLLLQETRTDTIDLPEFVKHFTTTIEHKKRRNRKDDNSGGQQTQVEAQAGVYVQRKDPHVQLDTKQWCSATHEVVAVRIDFGGSDNKRLLIVSAYYRPATGHRSLNDFNWIRDLRKKYSQDYTLFCGDFNAMHAAWGSNKTSTRGTELYDAQEQAHMTLVNDMKIPTRYGISARRQDTVLDLAWASPDTIDRLEWIVREAAWGSDHFPIEMTLTIDSHKRTKRTTRTVIWNNFRRYVRENINQVELQEVHVHAILNVATFRKLEDAVTSHDVPTLQRTWGRCFGSVVRATGQWIFRRRT
ncbi:hypothetical protein ISCGN_025897 [Ixodes scapularis]